MTDKESFYKFHISDDTTSDKLFVYNDGLFLKTFDRGDTIDIQGEFLKYKEEWELKLRNNTDDGITKVANGTIVDTYEDVTLAGLMGNTDNYKDKAIKIANATVGAGGVNWKFNITDGAGNILLVYTEKFADGGIDEIHEGDYVEVKGKFTYYETGGYWEIMIRKDSDDKITELGSAGPVEYTYIEAPSVSELLDNGTNGAYRDKSIKLLNVVIVTMSSRYNYIFGVNDTAGPFNINLTIYGFEADELALNDTVNIYGLFQWYADKGFWEIEIRSNTTDKVEKAAT